MCITKNTQPLQWGPRGGIQLPRVWSQLTEDLSLGSQLGCSGSIPDVAFSSFRNRGTKWVQQADNVTREGCNPFQGHPNSGLCFM